MQYLAKNFSARTFAFQAIFVAIIGVCIAGVSRHSLLLEWSPLVATFVLLIADPLTSPHKASVQASVQANASAAPDSAVKRKVLSPSQATPSPAGTLVSSEV
jgi:hypothetical protein